MCHPVASRLLLMLLTVVVTATASPNDHRYNVGDEVPLFVNKVGPLNNPSETYEYYDLPFCSPGQVIPKKESIGEVLNGDRLANTLYELKFAVNKSNVVVCHKKLSRDEVAKFRNAIINDFYFEMYYDDLPFWGFIGKVEDENWTLDGKGPMYFLFNHVQFDVLYNDNQVTEIRAFSDPNHAVDITEDVELDVEFTYSAFWDEEPPTQHKARTARYSKASLLPLQQKIHWFSFINSIVIILLLTGFFVMVLMQRLKNDLRFSGGDEEEDKEVGWKYLHGDVFRCPSNMPLFCGIIGAGTQLLTLICFLFVLSFLGVLYPYNRGALSTSLVIVYTLTSAIAGFTAASFYSKFVETGWERSVILAAMLFLVPFLLQGFILNLVAVSFKATLALPFGTIVVILLIYALIAIPLLTLGGVVGYRCRSEFQAPSAQKKSPREIPSLSWYQKTPGQMFLAGLLPFSAIVLELHHLYTSIWGHKIFTLPGVLFVMFVILILLTLILSVGLTYFQLTAEDHEWWWRSIFRGGSTAVFMFAYSIYFYYKSNMSGFLQTGFFFGYTASMCYAFFIVLATISFLSSFMFVCHIYRAVKSE
ncbi:PREDICTED: transmembrane 9 superfamily member 5-like isoform X2 [Ipomoea nil]|uniref:transmembrane 9 superfamily member 5-like isoform X2 n=1 Tax=Ipomoea nil TaxID=35883 RepID=UPI000900890D|nr:PREDICTED: transmembrane 9 superfamily member 5-like isoform X2 [Ipomoea nil]